MKPTNSKSLLHFVFDQMEKLDEGKIDVQTAQAQANLLKQANNLLSYELKRCQVKMEIDRHNYEYKKNVELREIEGNNF